MRRLALLTSAFLLLASCGTPPTNTTTPPTPSGGFMVDQQTSLQPRKVVLPRTTPLALQPGKLQAAALPTWTGPTLLDEDMYFTTLDANSSGMLYLNQTNFNFHGQPDKPRISQFAPEGTFRASKVMDLPSDWSYPLSWMVLTEDVPDQEVYQLASMGGSPPIMAEVYDPTLTPLNAARDHVYPVQVVNNDFFQDFSDNTTQYKAGPRGIVFMNPHPFSWPHWIDLYAASYTPWESVEAYLHFVIRPPREYNENDTAARVMTASDGSIYLAVATSYQGDCSYVFTPCPSIVGITKFSGENVEWQVYWETAEAIRVEDIATTSSGVSLLVTRASWTQEDPALWTNHLLNFTTSGDPVSDQQLPLAALRAQHNVSAEQAATLMPVFTKMKADDTGFVLMNPNVMASGNSGSLNHAVLLSTDPDLPNGRFSDFAMKGQYVYAIGRTENGAGGRVTPRRAPYDPTPAGELGGQFLFALNRALNFR